MRRIARREFFKHLSHVVTDSIDTTLLTPENDTAPSWVKLGRSSEMAPGKSLPFDVGGVKGVLYSSLIGLRARRENGKCVAVRSTFDGFIEINVNEYWPPEQALSHATGTAVLLNEEEREI